MSFYITIHTSEIIDYWSDNQLFLLANAQTQDSFLQICLFFVLIVFGLCISLAYLKIRRINKNLKQRFEDVKIQSSKLKDLDTAKSQFFANISHELRTPLTLIQAPISNVLEYSQLNREEEKLLKVVQKNARQLLQLTNDVLDLSKLEHSKLDFCSKPTVLYLLVRYVIASFESSAQQKQVQLQLDFQLNQTVQFETDAEKLTVVLNNLLSNALKFTPEKGKIVTTVKNAGCKLQIVVEDSGIGIRSDELPYIFNRYYQVSSTKGNAYQSVGTGIGLALCKEYAKLFGGDIWVKSEYGKGSTFTFEFPKKEIISMLSTESALELQKMTKVGFSPHSEQKSTSRSTAKALNSNANRKTQESNINILLVEDNYSLCDYLQITLSNQWSVWTASNGQEALDFLEQTINGKIPTIDLVITDVMMPIMNGIELLERLRNNPQWQHIPIIMLTAKAKSRDKIDALRIGVDDYIIKPFEEQELTARIHNILTNYQQRQKWVRQNSTKLSMKVAVNGEKVSKLKEANTLSFSLTKEDLAWLKELEGITQKNIRSYNFNAEFLSDKMALSRRQLHRKLKQLTGLSPSQYLKEARLQAARILLENQTYPIVKSVCYEVGLRDVKYFSQQFKKRFGRLPSDYL